MSDREAILARIGSAWPWQAASTEVVGRPVERESWALFTERLHGLGGEVAGPEALTTLVERSVYSDEDAAAYLPEGVRCVDDPWQAEIGVTLVDWAVAETGSLLIATGSDRRRLASLCPPHHYALVPEGRLLATLEEALGHLTVRTTVLVTGPSRTADIEGVLIRGVHGPGSLTAVRL
ncbi:MAG TPA: LUD domain-containing protein [Fimbriimonadaceae bacterium]|nr:LUD domain-containing protein [Fimbriimonadaceae bacterium]HRJ97458.1 LUD domain-containing protein [Fimbriimonadaceae bacterium]